ncbi:oocyte zinc finger protein XlCOF6-like isoform X3 [Thrips palmi]|nr:oocyte zinc finger protein XlCOF6-like isoform X3 [Thrips palmi]XP_034233367.1 oocyte zinc finger protein XlCOF6-like isoform X3 [Thrips palmi]
MFSETTSEAPVSPAASRDYDADICEDIVPDTTDLETSGPTSPDIQNAFKEHSEQVQEIDDSKMDTGVHQKGETERSIADVTEENKVMVCLERKEDFLSVTEIEKQSQIDHCYSREKQNTSQIDVKSQQERSRIPKRLSNRLILPRPILPRPAVNFVQNPQFSKANNLKNIVPKPQQTSPQIIIVMNKTDKQSSTALPFQQIQNSAPISVGPKRLLAAKPKNAAFPILPVVPFSSSHGTLPKLTKLKDLTVTRVPVGAPKKSPVKMAPKASVTIVKGGSYHCKICSAKFMNEMVFKRHMYLSHNVKKHTCVYCQSAFGTKMDLQFHVRQAHRTITRNITQHFCKTCNAAFDKAIDLRVHIRDQHRKTFSRFEDVIQNRKKILGVAITDKEAEMLRECHSRVDNKDVYNCCVCKKSWSNLEKIVAHVRTHTKEQLYACETCGQRFNTKGVMHRHMQIHKNVKPYACDYCDKAFSSKQNRDDHHRLHTKEVKTVCESCGEFLTSASMLYYHRKIHSGINPYKCPYCDKAYSIRSLLKRHIRYHTGETPHLCSVCGRGFKTSGQLRGHSAVHTDERPFSCDGCGATMKTKKYLNRHRAICPTLQTKANDENTVSKAVEELNKLS